MDPKRRQGNEQPREWWGLLGCSVVVLIFVSTLAALWCSHCELRIKLTAPSKATAQEGSGREILVNALTLANLHWLEPPCKAQGLLFFDPDTTALAIEFACPGSKGLEGVPDYVLHSALSWGEEFRVVDRLPVMLTVLGVCKQWNSFFATASQSLEVRQWDFFFDHEKNRLIVVFGKPSCTGLKGTKRDDVHRALLSKAFYYSFFSDPESD